MRDTDKIQFLNYFNQGSIRFSKVNVRHKFVDNTTQLVGIIYNGEEIINFGTRTIGYNRIERLINLNPSYIAY